MVTTLLRASTVKASRYVFARGVRSFCALAEGDVDKAGRPLMRHRNGEVFGDATSLPPPLSSGKTDPLWGTPDFDADVMSFPREGPGRNYALNWSLCTDDVSPMSNAYRNLSIRKLQNHGLSVEKNGTVSIESKKNVLPSDLSGDFATVYDSVTDHLSNVTDVFVHDASIGSHRSAELRTRIISDTPAFVAAAQKILCAVPTRAPKEPHPITIYHTSKMTDQSFIAISKAIDHRVHDELVHTCRIVVSGDVSVTALQAQIAVAAETINDAREAYTEKTGRPGPWRDEKFTQLSQEEVDAYSLDTRPEAVPRWRLDQMDCAVDKIENISFVPTAPISCFVFLTKSKKSILLFTFNDSKSNEIINNENVYAKHHAIWTDSGVARAWSSHIEKGTSKTKGDVNLISSTSYLKKSNMPNLCPHPESVIFVTGKKMEKMKVKDAATILKKAGYSESNTKRISNLMDTHKTKMSSVKSVKEALEKISK